MPMPLRPRAVAMATIVSSTGIWRTIFPQLRALQAPQPSDLAAVLIRQGPNFKFLAKAGQDYLLKSRLNSTPTRVG